MILESNPSWQLSAYGLNNLALKESPMPTPGEQELLVRVRAISLNYRDLLVAEGALQPAKSFPLVPASDAAGEVVEVGDKVTSYSVGDSVVSHFHTRWLDGELRPSTDRTDDTLGAPLAGMLTGYVRLHEDWVVPAPGTLSAPAASTLPVAALTAWTALFENGRLRPGETVLVQGTGGVSLFALQFAKVAGARVIVTSSDDAKIERVLRLGADAAINYSLHPDWHEEALRITNGRGVDLNIETVGGENLTKSAAAAALNGRIALVGFLEGANARLDLPSALLKRLRLFGETVGHRRSFERMLKGIELHRIEPAIDSVFSFAEAPAAFERITNGPFGKVVIEGPDQRDSGEGAQ